LTKIYELPIAAYCVEHGRWGQRGSEDASRFASSEERIATKDLKLAATRAKSQSAVWQEVANTQDKLRRNVGAPVKAAQSESSLPLSLEHQKVKETTEAYIIDILST
jgi:hypothetical protein